MVVTVYDNLYVLFIGIQVGLGDIQTIPKLTLNVYNLRKCWSVNNVISKEDWTEWLRRLSIGFLTESNSPAIR